MTSHAGVTLKYSESFLTWALGVIIHKNHRIQARNNLCSYAHVHLGCYIFQRLLCSQHLLSAH